MAIVEGGGTSDFVKTFAGCLTELEILPPCPLDHDMVSAYYIRYIM